MIERLLAADAALEQGELERAERLFTQVADADPRNAIAVVGLARLAARRGDPDGARELVDRALAIDPEEAAAKRLLVELDSPPTPEPAPTPAEPAPAAGPAPSAGRESAPATRSRLSLLDRIRRWLGRSRGPR